jgi:hypothetical protein
VIGSRDKPGDKEQGGDGVSEALKRKDQLMKERRASRRRVRWGACRWGRQ